ncbi:acyl-CoA thioesterase [Sphingomonas baiyangensis]|uniref:Acyl-CoA thioesterase n=1 Tax=Sphingomonas baiyangensis TaxID=2572576 RepID=A0A4U1L2T1_9SPHN|nr:thioesterase family protein [Sphingomonas baiyangensis]TKD50530.1 acyl-CoA thioesterase [Sphingomonas baiyangensis]
MLRFQYPLRFAHCDSAGIAYYPRLFELTDAAIEDWTPAVLGFDRRTMHQSRGLGLPTVDLHADFTAPARLGELLSFDVALRRVGGSSIDLSVEVQCEGAPRFAVRLTQVLMDLAGAVPVAWPDDLRARLMNAKEPE